MNRATYKLMDRLITKSGTDGRPETQGILRLVDNLQDAGNLELAVDILIPYLLGQTIILPGDDPYIKALLGKMRIVYALAGGLEDVTALDAASLRLKVLEVYKSTSGSLEPNQMVQSGFPRKGGPSSSPASGTAPLQLEGVTVEQ